MKNIYLTLLALILASTLLSSPAISNESEKVLKVATMWDIPDLDPVQRGDAWAEKALVTETLVTSNQEYELLPQIATSWRQLDGKTWEFKLKDDVLFHDGSKLTADDVKFTLERSAKLDTTIANFLQLDHIDVVDPTTIRVYTKNPNSMLPSVLHYPELGIISRNSLDKDGNFLKVIGRGAAG